MILTPVDWLILGGYFLIVIVIGSYFMRRAGTDTEEFFLAGRSLPWWLLGTSMVATTFSTDTPNLVAELVRTDGLAANWVWWAFLITGMLTVFVFAPLWRRSRLLTDLEFYEERYEGRSAAFLRGFRAVYLGVVFNVIMIAAVTLAAAKIGGALFGFSKVTSVVICASVAVGYAVIAGFWGVVATDFLQFFISIAGSFAAAWVALRHPLVGGLDGLTSKLGDRLDFVPPSGSEAFMAFIVVPLAIQWWSVWYPGSEPGGGGYVVQRMLAAKDERHALWGTLWFNVAHYALRPWPWILVAAASILVYPDVASLRESVPGLDPALVGDDLAYPIMLRLLPAGWLGLMVASLAGAYMSTVDTHLNWGASYLVHDLYRRFYRPEASERHYVQVARWVTVGLMVLAGGLTMILATARSSFDLILQIGAGTGLIFILRWLWWRVNAWSEIVAMIASVVSAVAVSALRGGAWDPGPHGALGLGVAFTTLCWLVATLVTAPVSEPTLRRFYRKVGPPPYGWGPVRGGDRPRTDWRGFASWPLACLAVYGCLFGTGAWLFGRTSMALSWLAVLIVAGGALLFVLPKESSAAREPSIDG